MLVDLRDDDEGYIPLEVEYQPASAALPMTYDVVRPHPDLASHSRPTALQRGMRLAARLHLTYIAHHL